ncbi:hypothetical protein VNO80_04005 [Phaseolus coccineus]|uniref:Uncharacterized protein n=1 Tax=Phaseolus coccineus TaxID=3886 RepID=A0AAN9RN12_PHACN
MPQPCNISRRGGASGIGLETTRVLALRKVRVIIAQNNAGVMFCPFKLSEDGIEMQFATNHLGKVSRFLHDVLWFTPLWE